MNGEPRTQKNITEHQMIDLTRRTRKRAEAAEAEIERLRDALEGMCQQFAYWANPGLYTGGLSALEGAFEVLGWDDPHPCPEQTCDVAGCNKQVSCGWPSDDGYRKTCGDHYPRFGDKTAVPPPADLDPEPTP